MPRQIRVAVEDEIYKRIRDTYLKYKTWNEIVNEALAEYISRREVDNLERRMMLIVQYYYEVKGLKRVFAMLRNLERTIDKLTSYPEVNSNQTLLEIASKINEILHDMKKKLAELEEEQAKAHIEKIRQET